jgi:hypothetical protein
MTWEGPDRTGGARPAGVPDSAPSGLGWVPWPWTRAAAFRTFGL